MPHLKQLPVEKLVRSKFQPRSHFDEEAIIELAHSIRSNGILQPIIVRPVGTGNLYEIIAGERRWRAAQRVGLDKIDCLVNSYSDKQAAAAAAIENLNRSDLNPIEEAQAYKKLIEQFHYSHEEVAATIGKSRTKITNSLRLLSLDSKVSQMLINGKLSESHGKIMAGLDQKEQVKLAATCIDKKLSVRDLEKILKNSTTNLEKPNPKIPTEIKRLESDISEYLGSKVEITDKKGRGYLKIHYQNLDILDGILEKIGLTK